MVWAIRLPVDACKNPSAYRVLLILADHASPTGRNSFPHKRSIADTLGCSERTVQRALADLRALGLITPGDQSIVSMIRTDRRPTVYDLRTDLSFTNGETDCALYGETDLSRGDESGSSGETTGVAQGTVLNQRTKYSTQLQTARAKDSRRECPNSAEGHRFGDVHGEDRCIWCAMDRAQAAEWAQGVR